MAAENVSFRDPNSVLSSKFEDACMIFPSCISTQLKVDPDLNETNIINGNNEELEECETPENDEELNHFEYCELPVKQELNSLAILTQFKLDLDFPGTSCSDGQNKELEEGKMPANDEEHNHLKYSELQVKQEFNLPSNLTQLKLDLEFPGTSLYDGRNKELEEGETSANKDELNDLKYSEMPVKQEYNSAAVFTQLKLDIDFPGTSLSDCQNEDVKIPIFDYKYGFSEFTSGSIDYQLEKHSVYQPTLERNSNLEDNRKTGNLCEGKQYECPVCEKKFTEKGSLNKHERIHSGAKPYECKICEKKFSQICNLKSHERIHSGEKPYECKICEKKFSVASSLKSHGRIHSGEKPYECKTCEKKFSLISHLKSHERIHSGEKPYECKICEKKFFRTNNLKSHQRIHSREMGVNTPYGCEICGKKFSGMECLKLHQRKSPVCKRMLTEPQF